MSKLNNGFLKRRSALVLFVIFSVYVAAVSLGAVYLASHSREESYLQGDLVARFTFREKKQGFVENLAGIGGGKVHNPGWVEGNGYPVALKFDGRETFIEVQGITIERSFTVTSWLKSYNLGQNGTLLQLSSTDDSSHFTVFSPSKEGRIGVQLNQGDDKAPVLSERPLSQGWWQHVAVVYDHEGEVSYYINGQPAGKGKVKAQNPNYGQRTLIGVSESLLEGGLTKTFFLNAAMDSISIYNRALNSEEVSMLVSK